MADTQIRLNTQAQDGTLIPSKISTAPTDDFTFPHNVTVSGSAILYSAAPISTTYSLYSDSESLVLEHTDGPASDQTFVNVKGSSQSVLNVSIDSKLISFTVTSSECAVSLYSGSDTLKFYNTIDMGGNSLHNIINVADPVDSNDVVTKGYSESGAQTLINKTIDDPTNTIRADKLSTTDDANPVVVKTAAPPVPANVLTAISPTEATWQMPFAYFVITDDQIVFSDDEIVLSI